MQSVPICHNEMVFAKIPSDFHARMQSSFSHLIWSGDSVEHPCLATSTLFKSLMASMQLLSCLLPPQPQPSHVLYRLLFSLCLT
jgi:hypothetical protein